MTAASSSGVSGQYHPPPAAQIRIPKAEYRRPKPRLGISGFGFGPLRLRVGDAVKIRPASDWLQQTTKGGEQFFGGTLRRSVRIACQEV